MASTTSTEQSGLFAHLLPAFKKASGIDVRVVALGTGQALDMGRRGDADVLFVHDQVAEEKFVADGFGVKRLPVMYNDFVLIGPKADPAGVRGKDIVAALKKLAAATQPSSRAATRAAPTPPNCATGSWPVDLAAAKASGYKECGCGMGPALNMASSPTPTCWPTAAPGSTSRTAATWRCWSKATSAVQPVRRDGGQPGQAPACQGGGLAQKFVDWVVSPAGQARSPATRSAASSCYFFPLFS
jgi:tungstate transport system substrate-binding protein